MGCYYAGPFPLGLVLVLISDLLKYNTFQYCLHCQFWYKNDLISYIPERSQAQMVTVLVALAVGPHQGVESPGSSVCQHSL